MSRGSDHNGQGIRHVLTSIVYSFLSSPSFVSVREIHPGIARDLGQHQASCAVSRMLEHFLGQVTAPGGEKHDPASLFSDVRDAVLPIANKLHPLVDDYCAEVDQEIERCIPFVRLINAILAETEKFVEQPGQLAKYCFRRPSLGLLAHRNTAKPINVHYNNGKTKIIPNVLFTSLAAAFRVSDEILTSWAKYTGNSKRGGPGNSTPQFHLA
ncbi:hypothetical protein B0H17DRAFT_45433 [Mycena rosella]|uniref:Uncharacterized protein n=1 Tax=Mycena rosella TaxID=1033263 RepID=A0AAD7D7F2_MYCRO|nr:hypothetical protein B0H17DRAFT_45433 [Mycena rosella]